ncbi:MAG: hypothetical protein ACI4JQ_00905, partial [Ruminococcus sp.]
MQNECTNKKIEETADSAQKILPFEWNSDSENLVQAMEKVSSGISEQSKSGAQRQILRTVRALSNLACYKGSPFKESWLAEGKTERLR